MSKQIRGVNLLTVADVASDLVINEKTVRLKIKNGELAARRIGRAQYVSEASLVKFLKGE